MESLSKIFGSNERVRIMRMFLFNPDSVYGVDNVVRRTGATSRTVDKELNILERSGFLRRKPFSKSAKDIDGNKRRGNGWTLDKNFPHLRPLESLLIQQALMSEAEIIKRVSRVASKIKMILIAGLFIQDPESRLDLLIVGDGVKRGVLGRTIKSFEAEIGKEIRYAAFETLEFQYRVGMYDKLVRDIFDYPHRKILDKLGLQN